MSWEGKTVTPFDKLKIDEANKVIDGRRGNFGKIDGLAMLKVRGGIKGNQPPRTCKNHPHSVLPVMRGYPKNCSRLHP